MVDRSAQPHPNEDWLRVGQAAIWAVVFMCTWLAVVGLLPGPMYEDAEALRQGGTLTVTDSVRRHIETGRQLHVSEVEVSYSVDGRIVTTTLRHVGPGGDYDEEIVPRDGPDWGDGPYEWWEDADEVPRSSRYAPPLEVRYLPQKPDVAMAEADLATYAAQARSEPAAALLLTAPALALLVTPVRRLALRRRTGTSSTRLRPS